MRTIKIKIKRKSGNSTVFSDVELQLPAYLYQSNPAQDEYIKVYEDEHGVLFQDRIIEWKNSQDYHFMGGFAFDIDCYNVMQYDDAVIGQVKFRDAMVRFSNYLLQKLGKETYGV